MAAMTDTKQTTSDSRAKNTADLISLFFLNILFGLVDVIDNSLDVFYFSPSRNVVSVRKEKLKTIELHHCTVRGRLIDCNQPLVNNCLRLLER